jgi:tricorn protease
MSRTTAIAALLSALGAGAAFAAPNIHDTRLLDQPAVSATHVAFVYADDLWVARLDGTEVRRLTTDEGIESDPVFSPDGTRIAFSAQYDGNTDVYLIPVEGGVPTRLTWHPGPDVAQAFTPDGTRVLFVSGRAVFTTRYTQLFTVSVEGGMPEALPLPNAASGAYSPDGRRIAYNPIGPRFQQWKRYRGGTASRIWLYDTASHAVEQIPQPPTRSNDVDAMWVDDTVYFRSDRDGEFNLYAFDVRTRQVRRLTDHRDFPVLHASAGGGHIVYEQAGYLHLLDPATGSARRLPIGVATDLRETRPRYVKGPQYIRSAALSPSGARAAFEFRGEIVTVPAEKGDARNLTGSTAANDRSPAWSPDGTRIAYFTDESGEYVLAIRSQDGKGAVETHKLSGAGFYFNPKWSPDGRKIAYTDNSQTAFVLDLETGVSKTVGGNRIYSPTSQLDYGWSPDSKWLAWTADAHPLVTRVSIYSLDQDRSFPVTDGLSEVTNAVFDRSGKYLYMFGSTDAGPVQDWFAQSSNDMRRTRTIYLAVLRKSAPSPLARQSDEERPATEAKTPGAGTEDRAPVIIDFDGLEHRILAIPGPSGQLSSLQAGSAGQLYYLKADGPDRNVLHHYDLDARKDDTLLPDVDGFDVSADGKKLLYVSNRAWFIAPATGKVTPGEGRLATGEIEVKIDPVAEWAQIFDEAWRINRDYFYAPNMHGVDWTAMRGKYGALLADVATRSDLNRVIQWMMSELSVGHHRGGGGDRLEEPKRVPGGLLGTDYEIANGRYRFAKVYGGLNWNPELRSPLTEPGVDVREGEYLLAVDGRDVRPPANLYSFFENTSGKILEMTVGPNPDGAGSRVVQVVPIASENALRNRDWVEENIRKVDAATGGRVAYVYVPNTAGAGYDYFKRYFYPQAHKEAIIVDERFNGGGSVADYYIDILRRPLIAYWAMRYGDDLKTPTASIQGPKVMVIDETAGSGGDLLPWMWRKFDLGPLVGRRTWGGLVGVLGFPVLMDGGVITAPNLAIWTPDEGWVVENEGVPPDIEVEQWPAEVIAGHDPQLERAIGVVMDALRQNPPPAPKRPPYPVKKGG